MAITVPEFGYASTTCNGDMTGCAVCTAGAILRRLGKPIPRVTDPRTGNLVFNARSLGKSMGARHRAIAPAGASGSRHGLSLAGECSPPHAGTNWCAYCITLELRARGLTVRYVKGSASLFLAELKKRHPIAVPGRYSEIPVVSASSYSSTAPAHGRSDSGFGGWHMVAALEVRLDVAGHPTAVEIADPDFGSASRPVVPPYSLWRWEDFLSYYNRTGGWGVAVVDQAPAVAPALPTTSTAAELFDVSIDDRSFPAPRRGVKLYSRVGGTYIGTVHQASYRCSRSQPGGVWWYTIASGTRKGQAFKPNRYVEAEEV